MTEFSAKEQKLLKLICDDYKNIEIASELDCSLRYVERLKASLHKKTNTSSNVSLLKGAVLNGYYTIKRKYSVKKR